MNTPSTTVKINVPVGILQNVQTESRRIGISVQDFIRMLMATYFANAKSINAISRDQSFLDRAYDEIKKGKYTKVTTSKQLTDYFTALDK